MNPNPASSDASRQASIRRASTTSRPRVVHVPLSNDPRFVVLDRAVYDHIVAALGAFPRLYLNAAGSGHAYVRFNLRAAPGEARDNNGMLSRLILGQDSAGRTVRYRDGNPLNLTRANLRTDRGGGGSREAGALERASDDF